MDLSLIKEIVILCLFLVVLFCVLLPLKFTSTAHESGVDLYHSERYSAVVSILNCFAAGIFLGTCLLHLFPDVRDTVSQAMEKVDPDQKFPFAEFTIAMGFFMLLTIEQIISDARERNFRVLSNERQPLLGDESGGIIADDTPSEIVNHGQNATIRAFAMIFALSIHSTFEGIAIGVQSTVENVLQITGALIIHKIVIAFSLGLTLSQSPLSLVKSAICGLIFALTSPCGIAIGLWITHLESLNGSLVVGSLQGMAAGTFLYVTFLEVLPHEFRSGHLHLPKLLSLILGFAVICGVIFMFPD
ncbi:unnamed protein product [Orchesella dallaii]|uniref:Zinc transporter ZIP1 n=1 Tax=Orchesella dallaii TaxID=48710 RepID=A0ABP1RXK9_9HEXA